MGRERLGGMKRMGAEGGREDEHTRETRKRGRRRKGRGQCRRTEPEALKFLCFPLLGFKGIRSLVLEEDVALKGPERWVPWQRGQERSVRRRWPLA